MTTSIELQLILMRRYNVERHDDMDVVQARWDYLEYWETIHRSSVFFQNKHQNKSQWWEIHQTLGARYIVLTI